MENVLNKLQSFPPESGERTNPVLCKFTLSLFLQVKKKKIKMEKGKLKERGKKKKHLLHFNEGKLSPHSNGGADNNIWL